MDLEVQINRVIGRRVKERRRTLMLNQSDLGLVLGVAAQQISKYESGTDRISAAHAWRLSAALDMNINDLISYESAD